MIAKMFSFITEVWNPLGGGPCPGECSYCWATNLKARYKYPKYLGPWRVDEKVIDKTFKPGAFVFTQDMSDLWAPSVPEEIVYRILQNQRYQPEVTFLNLTKFPETYQKYANLIPENAVLGVTIETNHFIHVSKTPHPHDRFNALLWVKRNLPNKTFISIEPIMEFDRDAFLPVLNLIHPWAIAVGYDNYRNKLPEPSLAKTRELISALHARGITVYEKTLREAWSVEEGKV